MDDAFRNQLDNKEAGHQQALAQLVEEKQEEIDFANKRVRFPTLQPNILLYMAIVLKLCNVLK